MHSEPLASQQQLPLVTTKLYRPHIPVSLVARPRLLEILNQGLERRLILVAAPAGYGKSTVVIQWLGQVELPTAWISLDEHDADLAIFLSYFLAAIRTAYPEAGWATDLHVRAPALPPPGRLADALLHDLAELPGPLILVLDDYHVVHTQEIQTMMARVVQYLPAHVHLVLTTRADPPFPLERLRGRQQIAEVRGADLRFTVGEARQLLRQELGDASTDETVALLEKSTEGWGVGLHLAAIALRQRESPASFVRKIAESSHQLVMDYMLTEVLRDLPDAQRAFLLQSSLLDRFCIPLCDAIRDETSRDVSGEAFLQGIRRANLFLIPLDDQGIWFRYHHLFQQFLQARLHQRYTRDQIRAIHRRAHAWFVRQGLFDEALDHALKADDLVAAATLVEEQVHRALDREDWRQVGRWLGLLPAAALERPRLLVAQAWLNYILYQFGAIRAFLDRADEILVAQHDSVQAMDSLSGEIAVLRATVAYYENDPKSMVTWAERAMQDLPPEMHYATSLAIFHQISGLQATGDYRAAVRLAHEQMELHGREPVIALRILLALNNVHYEMGNATDALEPAALYQQLAQQTGLGLSTAWSHYIYGWLHYQCNELSQAEAHFRDLVAIAPMAHGRAILDGAAGLVRVFLAQGEPDRAQEIIVWLRDQLVERNMISLSPMVDSLRQRVLLHTDPAAARQASYQSPELPLSVEFWEQPVLTEVCTLLAQGAPQALERASHLLSQHRAKAAARHSRRAQIEVGGFQALVYAALGDEAGALEALRQAVEAAASGGSLRLLADCGPGLIPLLRKLHRMGVKPDFVSRVLDAISQSTLAPGTASVDAPPRPIRHETAGAEIGTEIRVEELTNREIDVLILLSQRLTNQEIADRLFLAPATVKKHTLHIYQKLGVHNRRAAAVRAQRMGLI